MIVPLLCLLLGSANDAPAPQSASTTSTVEVLRGNVKGDCPKVMLDFGGERQFRTDQLLANCDRLQTIPDLPHVDQLTRMLDDYAAAVASGDFGALKQIWDKNSTYSSAPVIYSCAGPGVNRSAIDRMMELLPPSLLPLARGPDSYRLNVTSITTGALARIETAGKSLRSVSSVSDAVFIDAVQMVACRVGVVRRSSIRWAAIRSEDGTTYAIARVEIGAVGR